MHRNGSGKKIENVDAFYNLLKDQGRTVATYCSRREYDAWQENLGELVHTAADGTEIRRHAQVKGFTRGGSAKISHNCVIMGNPVKYATWSKTPAAIAKTEWMAEWTYYPDSYLDDLLKQSSNPNNPTT